MLIFVEPVNWAQRRIAKTDIHDAVYALNEVNFKLSALEVTACSFKTIRVNLHLSFLSVVFIRHNKSPCHQKDISCRLGEKVDNRLAGIGRHKEVLLSLSNFSAPENESSV